MNVTTPTNDYATLLRVAPDGQCQRWSTGLVTAEQVARWESVNGRSAWVPDNEQQSLGWMVWWIPFSTIRAILALSVMDAGSSLEGEDNASK